MKYNLLPSPLTGEGEGGGGGEGRVICYVILMTNNQTCCFKSFFNLVIGIWSLVIIWSLVFGDWNLLNRAVIGNLPSSQRGGGSDKYGKAFRPKGVGHIDSRNDNDYFICVDEHQYFCRRKT